MRVVLFSVAYQQSHARLETVRPSGFRPLWKFEFPLAGR